MKSIEEAKALTGFLDWATGEKGQALAEKLDYAPLSAGVQAKVKAALRTTTFKGRRSGLQIRRAGTTDMTSLPAGKVPLPDPRQPRGFGRASAETSCWPAHTCERHPIVIMLSVLVGVLLVAAWPSIKAYGFGFLTSSQWRANELELPVVGADGKVLIEDGEVVTQTLAPQFGALPATTALLSVRSAIRN